MKASDTLHNYIELLPEVETVARSAGEFIRTEFGNVSTGQVQVKSLNSLVSYVDINAEKYIVDGLKQLIPESGFITEEDTAAPSTHPINWVIDPLDGTTNFLKGVPVFSVSIALVQGDTVLLGLVYDIMQDWCFAASKGGGAFMNGRQISVSRESDLSNAVIATGFPYEKLSNDSKLFELLKGIIERSRGIRRLGSAAIDLAYVACGKVEAYYETTLNIWDIAAGILLVEEAGGHVTDFDGSRTMLNTGRVLASNNDLHGPILDIIREKLD